MASLLNDTYLTYIKMENDSQLAKLSEDAFGVELLHTYVLDVLGRNSTFSSKLYDNWWHSSKILVYRHSPVELQILVATGVGYANVMMVLHCLEYGRVNIVDWTGVWLLMAFTILGY